MKNTTTTTAASETIAVVTSAAKAAILTELERGENIIMATESIGGMLVVRESIKIQLERACEKYGFSQLALCKAIESEGSGGINTALESKFNFVQRDTKGKTKGDIWFVVFSGRYAVKKTWLVKAFKKLAGTNKQMGYDDKTGEYVYESPLSLEETFTTTRKGKQLTKKQIEVDGVIVDFNSLEM